MRFLSRFVDSNDRELRRLQPWVEQINALEAEYEAMSDEDIRVAFGDRAPRSTRRPSATSRPKTSSTTPISSAAAS